MRERRRLSYLLTCGIICMQFVRYTCRWSRAALGSCLWRVEPETMEHERKVCLTLLCWGQLDTGTGPRGCWQCYLVQQHCSSYWTSRLFLLCGCKCMPGWPIGMRCQARYTCQFPTPHCHVGEGRQRGGPPSLRLACHASKARWYEVVHGASSALSVQAHGMHAVGIRTSTWGGGGWGNERG